MVNSKATLLLAILCFLLVHEVNFITSNLDSDKTVDCQSKCEYRCSEASRHKICMRACRTCCARCNCVPPGTVDNEETCPCYAKMITHGGRHKCP
ncbi:hypothetical protein CsSME_00034819 [Camellia sinensis var. sinensis]